MTTSTALSVRAAGQAQVNYRMGGTEVPMITDSQCHVCNSDYRFEAEEQIIVGASFKKIRDRLPEDADLSVDSLRRHWKNHMALEQSETRGIIERRAQRVGKLVDDTDEMLVDGITLLETVVQKTFERIARGEIQPTIKDGLNASKVLAELGEYDDAEMDQQAYVEAFSVYQDEARRLMGDDMFEAFGDRLANSPVLAALVARYNGEGSKPEPEAASEDS